jgi:hypothetical protein
MAVASEFRLGWSDLAAVVKRALGDRVREVACASKDEELRLTFTGLDLSGWLPRLNLDVAVLPIFDPDDQRLGLRWKVLPSSLAGMIAAPAQRLGFGSKVIDTLIDRLGWHDAVLSRDNSTVTVDLRRLVFVDKFGIRVHAITIMGLILMEWSCDG